MTTLSQDLQSLRQAMESLKADQMLMKIKCNALLAQVEALADKVASLYPGITPKLDEHLKMMREAVARVRY